MLSVDRPLEPLRFDLPAQADLENNHVLKVSAMETVVTPADIKKHLLALAVFQKVHHTVQAGGVRVDDDTGLPIISDAAYLSVSRAQYRFDLWIDTILRRPGRDIAAPLLSDELPPVDVLMFLHAYMLSPWNYSEDCSRIYPELEAVGSFPFQLLARLIDMDSKEIVPTATQIAHWEACTGTSFAMPMQTETSETVPINCPRCGLSFAVPWINNGGTGYGQINFSATCPGCALPCNPETFHVKRFLQDLTDPKSVLAHTVLSEPFGKPDYPTAQKFRQAVFEALGNPKATDGDKFSWKLGSVFDILKLKMNGEDINQKLNHIWSAYAHRGNACLDLGRAVLRQSRFVQQMHDIGWAGKSSFEGEETSLPNAIVRYSHFLALDPVSMVASLDVDLAFHTHQLKGPQFRAQSFDILGRLLNHDDSFDKEVIVNDMKRTVKTWESAYGSVYVPERAPHFGEAQDCAHGCSGSIVGTVPGTFEPCGSLDD